VWHLNDDCFEVTDMSAHEPTWRKSLGSWEVASRGSSRDSRLPGAAAAPP
jgi:hypothetical protein